MIQRMRKGVVVLVVAAVAAAVAAPAFAQSTAATTARAQVTIALGVGVSKTRDLDFSRIVPSATAGNVVVSPASARTSTGGVTLLAPGGVAARFNLVHNGPFGTSYTVTIPNSITISNGSSTMVVDTFTNTSTLLSLFPYTNIQLDVGATLHVNANQPRGAYSGTFTVTVTEN